MKSTLYFKSDAFYGRAFAMYSNEHEICGGFHAILGIGSLITRNDHWDPSFLQSSTIMPHYIVLVKKHLSIVSLQQCPPPFPPPLPEESSCQIAFKIIAGFDRVGYLHLQIEKTLNIYNNMHHLLYITFYKFLSHIAFQSHTIPPQLNIKICEKWSQLSADGSDEWQLNIVFLSSHVWYLMHYC